MRSRIINILGNIPIWVMILLFPTLLSLGLFQPTDHYTGSSRLFIALSIIFTLVISCISVALVIIERNEVGNISCAKLSFGRSPYGNFFYKIRKKGNILTAHLYKWKFFWIGYAKVRVTVEEGQEKEAFGVLYEKMINKKKKYTSKKRIHENQLKMIKEFKNQIQDKETLLKSDSYTKELEKLC